MEGGNEASVASGITQFADRRTEKFETFITNDITKNLIGSRAKLAEEF